MKPGDVVKRKGADGRPVGPAVVIVERFDAIASDLCWACAWHWNGESRRRAFVEGALVPVGKPPPPAQRGDAA